jgi:4-diphosphocytidyl-2-C-methyl-D-erythritol kinase
MPKEVPVPALLAPAKLNLTLEVLSRRPDGYHTLRSVMAPLALYDRIEFEPAATATFAAGNGAPSGAENLVMRAIAAAGVTQPYQITLHKVIPIGGGLGGGSSDAAAMLRAAAEGAFGPAPQADWLEIARGLGSDVPFFLSGTAALIEGTGERVTPLGALPDWWAVVVQPPVAVATSDAYRLLDESRPDGPPSRARNDSASLRAVDALQRGDFAALERELLNDFHAPMVRAFPEVARADEALRSAAGRSLLSGSGSCLFALFESESPAREAAAKIDPSAVQAVFVCSFHHGPAWR